MANNDQDADRQDRLDPGTDRDQTTGDSARESRGNAPSAPSPNRDLGTQRQSEGTDEEDMDEMGDRDDDSRGDGGTNRRRSIS